MTSISTSATTETKMPLVLQFIPPAHLTENNPVALTTMMQSLLLDRRHPITLEIAGTAQQRCWLIRAATPEALHHLETQVRARFPDAELVPLSPLSDPSTIQRAETVSTLELRMAAASYLPLQIFHPQTLSQAEEDPIFGILAALDLLPDDMRAISQLALVPAPPTWSSKNQRKAIEHALEPERSRERWQLTLARQRAGAPSMALLIGGGILLGLLLYYRSVQQVIAQTLPAWLSQPLLALLRGHWPQLPLIQQEQLIGSLAGMLFIGVPFVLLSALVYRRLFRPAIYDAHQVQQQVSQMAYRMRLRLYVIGPAVALPSGLRQALTDLVGDQVVLIKDMLFIERGPLWLHILQWCWLPLQLLSVCFASGMYLPAAMLFMMWRHLWPYWCEQRRETRRRHVLLVQLAAAYRQFHLASGNYFTPRRLWPWWARRGLTRGWWRHGLRHSRQFLTVDAAASLWHVPAGAALPSLAHVAYRQSRTLLIPPALCKMCSGQPPVGYSEHAGHRVPFGFPSECLRHHFLIGGKSGEGKSTLLEHLIQGAMRAREGMVVVDPHGDLVEHTLRLVPEHRLDDVVLIDLAETEYAIGFNPLDVTMGHKRDKAISDLLKTFSHIWSNAWGSRMEVAFQMALRTLFEVNKQLCQRDPVLGPSQQYTLLEVMPVLTDESFCHSLLEHIGDPLILRWWQTYYDPLSLYMQRDRSDPVLSKVARFESYLARRIVGQSQSTINLSRCVQEEKLVFLKLAKGVVGEDIAALLGSTILGLLQLAIEEQADETQRRQLPLFIDEFQVLEGVDWATLAELRKYGATFYLATQSLEYLREGANTQLLPTVLANVKQLAIFHMSVRDAQALHQELGVEVQDITHLESYTCYLKLHYGEARPPTFSLKVAPPSIGSDEAARCIHERAYHTYMRPMGEIDAQIFARLARTLGAQPNATNQESVQQNALAQAEQPKKLARQDSGYRGRKAQEKRASKQERPGSVHDEERKENTQDITPMNWSETVGHPLEDEEEHTHEREA
jgi:hypothetical protein